MAILDNINEAPAQQGSVERGAQRIRQQAAQTMSHLEVMLQQMKRVTDQHGLAEIQAALDVQNAGDGADLAAFHSALVVAVKALKPDSDVVDLA